MKTKVFSKENFIKEMYRRNISDDTVENSGEFFICVDPTGGPNAQAYFVKTHPNVIRLEFDDCEKDETKWGDDIQSFYNAKAMIKEQAQMIVNFVKLIPKESKVNIYCTKGLSRSVAIESFIKGSNNGNKHVLKLLKETWTGK